MTTEPSGARSCEIVTEADVVTVRRVLREATRDFALVDQTKLVTAGSELARNILKYAGPSGGHMYVEALQRDAKHGVRVTFQDEGPGIADVELAMQDGYSTGSSLGLGLPGARRLVDEFSIESAVGRGTSVVVVKWER